MLEKMTLPKRPHTREGKHNQKQEYVSVQSLIKDGFSLQRKLYKLQKGTETFKILMTKYGMSCQGIYVTIPLSSQSKLWFSTFKSTRHQAKGNPVQWEQMPSIFRRPMPS